MNRITAKFQQRKEKGTIAFMPFIVAGDPDYQTSLAIAKTLCGRADFLEIGFPYSDPLADGPTIQAANNRALAEGMNTPKVFDFIKTIRKKSDIPITTLAYANLVYQQGIETFYRRAKKSGVDGVLIPDLPIEEAPPYIAAASLAKIDPIFLVAQTTTNKRLKIILKHARGYCYLVSILGVTGKRDALSEKTISLITRIKRKTALPLAVGFGISKPDHLQLLHRAGASGAIVGSALIKIIESNRNAKEKLLNEMDLYVKELTQAKNINPG